jgi:ATP-dependent Clp endopeptidase proteolytic subunit ClpP
VKVIPISGVIGWDVTGQDIRNQLAAADGEEIEVQLSSVGGFVFDGLEIFNLIKNYEGKKSARIMGVAASMGSYIPFAVKPDGKIISEANGVMMIHNAWGIAAGTADDMRAEATVLEGLSSIIADAYAKYTGKSAEDVKAMMDSETWMFGSEMLDAGFIDEIIGDETADKEASIKAARVALADAKKLVTEYEGGDNIKRVAALLDVMRPKNKIEKPGVAVASARADIVPKGKNMKTLEELKAEAPALFAEAVALGHKQGIAAEQKRVSDLEAWKGINVAVDAIVEDAKATGKDFLQVQAQLSAASAKGAKAKLNDNAPSLDPTVIEGQLGGGPEADDIAAAKLMGMDLAEYQKYAKIGAEMHKEAS